MINSRKEYCTRINGTCNGFLCKDFKLGICEGISWAAADKDGNIIAIAKTAKPVTKKNNTDYAFKLKIDI